jgi:hypothetical protein
MFNKKMSSIMTIWETEEMEEQQHRKMSRKQVQRMGGV